ALGEEVLENRRENRGLLAQVDGVGGEDSCGVHQPGVATDACQRLLNTFEGGERNVELLADLRVTATDIAADLGGAGTGCREGDGTAYRQAVHQHHPAFADHAAAADDGFQRHEDVL